MWSSRNPDSPRNSRDRGSQRGSQVKVIVNPNPHHQMGYFIYKLKINRAPFVFFFGSLQGIIVEMQGSRHESEKAMAPHSSTLAWEIPWMEELGRLQSMGSLGVGHDWATSLSFFTFMHWRRKWQPTPVFLPGESQGRWSLVGYCLWGRTELDTTDVT